MVKRERHISPTLTEAMSKFPHLRRYVNSIVKTIGMPDYYVQLDKSLGKIENPNIIYGVNDPMFIHIYKEKGKGIIYHVVEPRVKEEEQKLFDTVLDKLIELAHKYPVPDDVTEIGPVLLKLYDEVVAVDDGKEKPWDKFLNSKIKVTKELYETVKYYLIRNRVGYAKLEPLFYDQYLEDIHCTGVGAINMIHKIFEMVHTNIVFPTDYELNRYIIEVSERVERPTSDAHPVVDAMMPDGSRVNFIYGREISLEGSSFTIRKFAEVPVSVTQVINWKTMSSEMAAYLWLCLENGMNGFVCGETASGKTTSLNALCAFIKPDDKVYTVENTPEVTMPHDTWQHLVTRDAGKSTDVTMFTLLIAALRSRPNYIIVGEIRGQEGSVAFQAMQTGHPVLSTFHAGNVTTMIQRLNGDPINIPLAFMNNLNFSLIQQAVLHHGHSVRRVLSITEIERYYEPENKMVTREVFSWEPQTDKHLFRGLYNSYLLESKIATMQGYTDTREIYTEMDLRKRILEKMIENKIFNYFDVWEVLKNYHYGGKSTLPFTI
ncbi:MAG: type II/IV secretion system ATPase subunit [Candidatus Woesearchaeota archaeon]